MKALGAREGQIRGIFLVEGACIGVVGGLLGVLAAWGASFPGDAVARSIMQSQTPRPIEESLFAYNAWLTVGAPALSAIVTTLAAVYPAHRAARVDPITSLRHE
jgi:putative ABC transport system permease protein